MSQTLQLIQQLVARGEIRISEHGYDELSADNISVETYCMEWRTPSWSKIIRNTLRDQVYSCYKEIQRDCRCTLYGEFPRARPRRRLSGRLTSRGAITGHIISDGGHEKKKGKDEAWAST